jgi:phage terminase large subunit GpA-like protein
MDSTTLGGARQNGQALPRGQAQGRHGRRRGAARFRQHVTCAHVAREEAETANPEPLLARRENYTPDALPYRILYLTAGIDVQDDRFEIEVVGWRQESRLDPEESWGVVDDVIYGDMAKPQIWNARRISKT